MPYIPHTNEDVAAMLDALGIDHIQQLYDEIPTALPKADLEGIPAGQMESAVTRLLSERAPALHPGGCFIGAGAYEHFIPAVVWELVSRGEYYTAYTPYQAEASQGNLQLIYEYQTMMSSLMGMAVSNASLYDGATALAESVLMAIRIKRSRAKRVVMPACINPIYQSVLKTILSQQGVVLETLAYVPETGAIDEAALSHVSAEGLAALIIPQPNFFGRLEAVDALTNKAHELGALVIALVNPMAMALLKAPGQWGENGADIVCGEGQPLGVPLMSGGPYFGFVCTKQAYLRQLPGRIVGRTQDSEGKTGYVLTLQAREQHIRRAKATSNICTNQGLLVTAAAIYMSVLGSPGLQSTAATCHDHARQLYERLTTVPGVTPVFAGPFFHEFVIRVDKPVDELLLQLADFGVQGGYALGQMYPGLSDCLLVCATETKTPQDLERYQQLLARCLIT